MALLWSGLACSAMGDQVTVVAMAWISTEAFGTWAGWLVAIGPLTVLLTVLFAGRFADRQPPLLAMIGADGVRGLALLGFVLAWSLTGSAPAWALVAAIVTLGAGQAVFRPALQVVVPAVIPDPAQLPAANALLDMTERLARLAGPAMAGVLAGLVPLMHLLTLDALTYAGSAAALVAIGRRQDVPRTMQGGAGSVLDAMLRGVRVTRRHPLMAWVLATAGVLNGTWFLALFLALPLMLARDGIGLAGFGLVISAYGVTNLAANLVLGSRPMPVRPARQVCAGNVVLGIGTLLIAASHALPPEWRLVGAMAGAAAGAAGGPMQDIPVAVLRQTAFAAPDVPAVMRAHLGVSQLGLLLGMLVAPALLGFIAPAWVIAGCGATYFLLGLDGLRRFRRSGA